MPLLLRFRRPVGFAARFARTAVFLFVAAFALLAAPRMKAAAPPNVVLILADDQGWGDLSATGNTNLSTPHIDSLARDGVTLDRFFVCPVCSPTRAEMLTGRYHPRTGVRGVSTGQERLNLDEKTLAQTLKSAGYATGAFGKWHNGSQWPYHPNARGFDDYYGFTSGHWGQYFDAPLEHNGEPVTGRGYVADDFTDRAVAFIEEHRERPFFCYLPLNTPHSPFCVPEADWARFKDKPIPQRGADGEAENLALTRCVLAMCENIDRNVGRVLATLDRLKLTENTIVIYLSDNGPVSGRWNGGMKGKKGGTDEGSVRVPFFLRWPGKIPPHSRVPQIAGAIDLLPTLVALTGVPFASAKPLDGRDLSPLLFQKTADWPERLLFSTFNGAISARSQTHRLDALGRLFDMVADPGQSTDIAERQPALARQMRDAVRDWRREMFGDTAEAGKKPAVGKDDRPFPVGYREFPRTPLPARDGVPRGGIQRSAGAPNCSYFVHWTSKEDRIAWDIDVHTAGDYEVSVLYTCPAADAGSTVELSFQGATLQAKVTPAWDPPLIADEDRVPRKGESLMKPFHELKLGTLHLPAGRGPLTLRATDIPGQSVMDLRQLNLRLKPAK